MTMGNSSLKGLKCLIYSAHTMLCELHTYYPCSLDLFIQIPFQLNFGANITAAISALKTTRTHYHLYPTRYLFTPESSEACKGKVLCQRTQHQNNAPILRGEKQDISLKILHLEGFELHGRQRHWQSSTL